MSRLPVLASGLVLSLAGACERGDTPPPQAPDQTAAGELAAADAAPADAAVNPAPEACAELELDACAQQGALLLLSDTPEPAVPLLAWSCSQGHADACANLASSYRAERLAKPAAGVVHELNERGCAAGSPRSCGMLGVDYYEGETVDKDVNKAIELFVAACDQDEAQSCALLGSVLTSGGEQDDLASAAKAFARACELGEGQTCKNAGALYLTEFGQTSLALGLFERGCSAGDAGACFNLGVVHGGGLGGVTQDPAVGEGWMRKACELGDQEGCDSAEQLAAAQDPNAVAGANLSIGSMDVDGMTIQDLQCRLSGGGGGLFGSMALVATLGEKKKAFDKCAPGGAAPSVRWDFVGGKTTVINVDDPSAKVAACVEKVMKKVPATMEAQCRATLLVGNKKGAEKAAAAR